MAFLQELRSRRHSEELPSARPELPVPIGPGRLALFLWRRHDGRMLFRAISVSLDQNALAAGLDDFDLDGFLRHRLFNPQDLQTVPGTRGGAWKVRVVALFAGTRALLH